jgi:riboflavin synthase
MSKTHARIFGYNKSMFSGLDLTTTPVVKHEYKTGSLFLIIQQPPAWSIQQNTAVSVNGVSLPVRAVVHNQIVTEGVQKTIERSSLGLSIPTQVTVEKALSVKDGISGHALYGLADAVGILEEIEDEESSKLYTFSYPEEHERYVDEHVFIAVDGISTQIIDCDEDQFTVRFPHFILEHTTMGVKKVGSYVNIEFDMMLRYLDKIMAYKSK